MTPRTIRNWVRKSDLPTRPPGRPRSKDAGARLYRALVAVRRVMRGIGKTAGEPAVRKALETAPHDGAEISLRAVREAVKRWKARDAEIARDRVLKNRVNVEFLARDAAWSQDGLHVGVRATDANAARARRRFAGPVEKPEIAAAEAVRDVGPCAFLSVRVGRPATSLDAIRALVKAKRATGTWPLVFISDNGPPYVSELFEKFLRALKIVHLLNLPRTPQHNAWSERGIGELKRESGLKARPARFRAASLGEAAARLNKRPRASRKLLTALELRRSMPAATTLVDRATFYAAYKAVEAEATLGVEDGRVRRRAKRKAVYETMERFRLIKRYRGGAPLAPSSAETIT